MGSYRKVGDDILKEWLDFREEELGSLTCKEDKEHFIYFEEISTDILNNVSGNNIESAISRIDNRTNICPTCGIKEALEQFIKQKNAPKN